VPTNINDDRENRCKSPHGGGSEDLCSIIEAGVIPHGPAERIIHRVNCDQRLRGGERLLDLRRDGGVIGQVWLIPPHAHASRVEHLEQRLRPGEIVAPVAEAAERRERDFRPVQKSLHFRTSAASGL
jgi:hypothetical protein